MSGCFIGCDPGIKHFSLSIVEGWNCLGTEILPEAIYNLRKENYDTVLNTFEDKIVNIITKYKPKRLTIERFVVRGFGANITELVGIMVGVIRTVCRRFGIDCVMITANQWKAKAKKLFGTKNLKPIYRKYAKLYKTPPHTIDSLLMARYGQNDFQLIDRDIDFLEETLKELKQGIPLDLNSVSVAPIVVNTNNKGVSKKPFRFHLAKSIRF